MESKALAVPEVIQGRVLKARRGRRTTWKGGIIRYGTKADPNVPRFYIWKKRAGVNYQKFAATSEAAAEVEYGIFEKLLAEGRAHEYRAGINPDAPRPITLNAELIDAFLTYSERAMDDGGKENGEQWLRQKGAMLAWWAEKLAGVDLRRATLRDHILPPLRDVYAPNRIRVIKVLYTWLRTEDRIATSEDPTFGKLKAPQSKSAQAGGTKTVTTPADYRKVIAHLADHWKDPLMVLAGTGWHLTEVDRFCTRGRILPIPGRTKAQYAILETPHKGGHTHRTIVSQDVCEAAKRHKLRVLEGAKGKVCRYRAGFTICANVHFNAAIRKACREAGVKPFTPGTSRHSVGSSAIDAGAELGAVSTFLGHKSPATTKKFYATFATAKKVPTIT